MSNAISKMNAKYLLVFLALLLNASLSVGQAKRALLIGVSEYQTSETIDSDNEWSNIHGVNDVEMLYPTLEKQGFEVKELCNSAATAKRIRKALKSLSDKCQKGDIIYLHFSCHGQPVEDLDGDENEGWDEAIIPVDAQKVYCEDSYTGENHIIDDELNQYLRTIRQRIGNDGFVYVIIDACHAGSSYRGEENEEEIFHRGTNVGFSASKKPFVPKIDKRGKFKVETSTNMADICVLEACRSYQLNSEICENGKYYGSLSYYVNQVLHTNLLGKDMHWTEQVSQLMNKDIRLVKQNLVIETSL